MGPLILLALGALGFAWWKGWLKGFSYEDGLAAVLFLLGLRLMATGRPLIGAGLMGGALLWAEHRRRQLAKTPAMSPTTMNGSNVMNPLLAAMTTRVGSGRSAPRRRRKDGCPSR